MTNPILIFSGICLATFSVLSFGVFLLSLREKSKLHKFSLQQWSLGLFFLSWLRIPAFLAAAGLVSTVSEVIPLYVVAFFASALGLVFLYRGAIALFSAKTFWLSIFPVLVFLAYVSTVVVAYFILHVPMAQVGSITRPFTFLVIAFFLIALTMKLWEQRTSTVSLNSVKLGLILIILGWASYIWGELTLQRALTDYPPQFWFASLVSTPLVYIVYTLSHLLLLAGFVFASLHLETLVPPRKKKPLLLFSFSALVLLGAVSAGLVISQEGRTTLSLEAEENRFITIGETLFVAVNVHSDRPANTVGATITFPQNKLQVESILQDDSPVGFWAKQPSFSNEIGTIEFAGIVPGGFQGDAKVMSILFRAAESGNASLNFADATVLAHDGKGTEILSMVSGVELLVRERGAPSPDLNKDGALGLADISILIFHWGEKEDSEYDLNQDGSVNLFDLSILISVL